MTKITKFLFSYWFLFTLLCRLQSRKSVETAVIHAACWKRFKNSVHTKKLKNWITLQTPLRACRHACLTRTKVRQGSRATWLGNIPNKACWHEHTYSPSFSFYFFIHLFYLFIYFFFLLRFASVLASILTVWYMWWFKPVQHCICDYGQNEYWPRSVYIKDW